jgi:hypothetical protein
MIQASHTGDDSIKIKHFSMRRIGFLVDMVKTEKCDKKTLDINRSSEVGSSAVARELDPDSKRLKSFYRIT